MTTRPQIDTEFPLQKYNTFGIPAVAAGFVRLCSDDDYVALMESELLRNSPFFILGGGSNVVLPDRYDGIIVHPDNKGVHLVGTENGVAYVEAGAGEVWAEFVDRCIDNGWHGLENLASIPGCVGAAPVQNVGAYGREAKDVVAQVHCYDIQKGVQQWIDAADCGFGYRWSRFKGEWKDRFLIDRVVFALTCDFVPDLSYKALATAVAERGIDSPTARQLADVVSEVRNSKLPNPKTVGSAGSFFKNPVVDGTTYETIRSEYPDIVSFPAGDGRYKLAAGWMIEHRGWKGRAMGRAGVYEKQALVLVNLGGCSGADVRILADAIIADVYSHFGVKLECEAIFV
jgi:UDP-N-acetylmuramate dehydrogenase